MGEKVDTLAGIPPEAFATIFRVEIDPDLLQHILAMMLSACSETNSTTYSANPTEGRAVDASWRILAALAEYCPKTLGFALNFAGQAERETVQSLLSILDACSEGRSGKDMKALR